MKTPQIAPLAGMTPLGARPVHPAENIGSMQTSERARPLGEILGATEIVGSMPPGLDGDEMPAYDDKTFQVGRTYTDRAAGDHDMIYRYKIVARTAKTLTIEEHGKTFKRGIFVLDGVERCKPDGTYSMCPVISADEKPAAPKKDMADRIIDVLTAYDDFQRACESTGPMPSDNALRSAVEFMRIAVITEADGMRPRHRKNVTEFFSVWNNLDADGPTPLDFWMDQLRDCVRPRMIERNLPALQEYVDSVRGQPGKEAYVRATDILIESTRWGLAHGSYEVG